MIVKDGQQSQVAVKKEAGAVTNNVDIESFADSKDLIM
jgi:hypothetical protein